MSLPYALGRFVARHPILVAAGVGAIIALGVLHSALERRAEENDRKTVQLERERRVAAFEANCRATVVETARAASQAVAQRDGDRAVLLMAPCEALGDQAYKDLLSKARGMAAEEAAKRAEMAARAAAAKARSEGVTIGMTQQQVLASNWGTPQRINTTTTKRGEREQWVYGSRSYLYFENGVLTAIQTGR